MENTEISNGKDVSSLAYDDVFSAFRVLDEYVLLPVIEAWNRGTLSSEIISLLGSQESLNELVKPRPIMPAKIEMGIKMWRRLTDVLDGKIQEEDIIDGLQLNEVDSFSNLIACSIRGERYRGLRYPLKEGEIAWLHVFGERIQRDRYKRNVIKSVSKPEVISSDAIGLLRDDPVRKDISLSKLITKVSKKIGVELRIGQNELIVRKNGDKNWSPKNVGEIIDAIHRFGNQAKYANSVRERLFGLFRDIHGIPSDFSRGVVDDLVRSREWNEPIDATVAEGLIAPHISELEEAVAFDNGKKQLLDAIKNEEFLFFEGDMKNPEVKKYLISGDIVSAINLSKELSNDRVKRSLVEICGTSDISSLIKLGQDGDNRPAQAVKFLAKTVGSKFNSVVKKVAFACGSDGSQVDVFVEATINGERVTSEKEAERRAKQIAWERSLLDVNAARALLGATQTEFKRWLDQGLIPVAMEVDFYKWRSHLTTTKHDPEALKPLKSMVPAWRDSHKEKVGQRRKEAAREAAKTRKLMDKIPDPSAVRKRRLAGLFRTAMLDGLPDGSAICASIECHIVQGVIWHLRVAVPIPDDIEPLLTIGVPLTSGKSREAVVKRLQDVTTSVEMSMKKPVSEIVDAWRERTETVSKSFPEGGIQAFHRVLQSELRTLYEENKDVFPNAESAILKLSALLDKALVNAVNTHSRVWGVDDLRARSGLANYAAMFPEARAIKRKLILHLGPTNSGKTHAALDVLASAETGGYFAPLRLMALEGSDRLNGERKVPTDMITGEEIVRVEGAKHVSATIEMADLSRPIDVAVIDEVQLIADRDRGWAWTQAIVGIPAKTIVMTGSIDALPFVTRIARMTGDEVEVRMFDRKTPLTVVDKPIGLGSVREGDAIVAFSRSEVLRLRDEIASKKVEVATIYGALGPEVRRAQAARFRSGDAKVLIATDAIAMGLNLPIQRVILSALDKYDGVSVRQLTQSEIRQIGGRAGRYGIAERGEVAVMPGLNTAILHDALNAVPRQPSDDRLPVMPPWPAVQEVSKTLLTDDLARILRHVTETLLRGSPDLRAPQMDDALTIANLIANSGLSLRQRFRYVGCPIDARDDSARNLLAKWAVKHATGEVISSPKCASVRVPDTDAELYICEQSVKMLSAYLWMAMCYPSSYTEHKEATAERDRVNGLIEAALRKRTIGRSCRKCGRRLSRGHPFPICDDCFRGRRDYY